MGKIILFYKYVAIERPSTCAKEQRRLCSSLGLTGRILIAQEGINGTLGGSSEAIEKYKEYMDAHRIFTGIDFKESEGNANYFPRLQVVVKPTIVNLGIDPRELTVQDSGTYLTPTEAHTLFSQSPQDLVILDARNDYESRIGTFRNSITPPIAHFRDFPAYIDSHLDLFKDKKVVMFCTGGIRCERATAYLKKKNIAQEVFHIKGGIHRYVENYPDGHFRGKNYVFDARITQKVTEDILGTCDHCGIPYDTYSNCRNAQCSRQIIVCTSCVTTYHSTCSSLCADLVRTNKVSVRPEQKKITISQP